MAGKAPKKVRPPVVPKHEIDFPAGFDPKPTVFKDGVTRQIQLWESFRDANDDGYWGGVVCAVKGFGSQPPKGGKGRMGTTCSPFTGTVIGAMFDPDGSVDKVCEPKYDDGNVPLPNEFYQLHNGN